MKLIKSSIELIEELDSLKKIELCGRVCYKSKDKITPGSAEKFVKMLIERGHESVLEHRNLIFSVEYGSFPIDQEDKKFIKIDFGKNYLVVSGNIRSFRDLMKKYENIQTFSKLSWHYPQFFEDLYEPKQNHVNIIFLEDKDLSCQEKSKHKAQTVRIICDRGVSHELVRHRIASYSQESTRYCNYKRKGLTCIVPPWITDDHILWALENQRSLEYDFEMLLNIREHGAHAWLESLLKAEKMYEYLIDFGWTPQQARSVLPNSLKTEVIMTTTLDQWHHILVQRTSKAAHPQMREIMFMILKKFKVKFPEIFNDIDGED